MTRDLNENTGLHLGEFFIDRLTDTFVVDHWGIPILDIDKQATELPDPIVWGDIARKNVHKGTYLFYCDDYKFLNLVKKPLVLVNSGCTNVAEVNFSTNRRMSNAVALYYIYQKRHLARIWQHFGINIAVDLCIEPKFYDIALFGVPYGWRSYITRGYNEYLSDITTVYAIACGHAGSDDINFTVYGGGKAVKELCDSFEWVFIDERMNTHSKKKKGD